MEKIIIFGITGMLGSYIYDYLLFKKGKENVIGITREIIDIKNSNINDIEQCLLKYNINQNFVIINCIGLIPQVKYDKDASDYFKINSIFPFYLNELSIKYGFKLIHPSTDCVYSGKSNNLQPYDEKSVRDESSLYGISKILGENLSNATIIRTSIIGEQKNANYSLLQWIISNKNGTIQGYTNHYWNGITCLQFAKIVEYIIDNNIYWKGIKHIFSNEIVSKYELLKIINDVYNLNINIQPLNTMNINKSLTTIYTNNFQNIIPSLKQQINDLLTWNYNLQKI